jgi:WD40 repeat protein
MSVVQKIEDATAVYALAPGEHGVGEDLLYMAYDPRAGRLAVALNMPENRHRVDVLAVDDGALSLASSFEVPRAKPRVLGFMPDGRLLYSIYFNVVISALDGEALGDAPVPQADAACVLPDGRVLFNKQRLVLWEAGAELREFEDKRAYGVGSVDVSPDGKFAVSTGNEPYVRLWDFVSGKQLKRVTIGSGGSCYAAFSPDGTVVACGGDKDKASGVMSVRLLNVDKKWSERARLTMPLWSHVFGLGFSADGERLWVSQHNIGQSGGVISVWDWRAGTCLHKVEIASAPGRVYARGVALSADGRRLFVGLPLPAARVLAFDLP